MPLPAVWGPKLWAVLHAIGARAGAVSNKALLQDETRYCLWLFEHLDQIVPCPECRAHIISYRRANPLPSETKELGLWIWTFHEAVNARLNKPPGPPFTQMLGRQTSLLESWKEYQQSIRDSVSKGSVVGDAMREWNRRFQLWMTCA